MNETREYVAAGVKKVNHVEARWLGETRFEAGRPGGPHFTVDTKGLAGPGPVEVLLCALATCSSIDVVGILAKRKTPAESLHVDVHGERAPVSPARVTHVHLAFTVNGAGIEREQAERAIDLSITKYCSVRDSLDPNLPIAWTLTLNGEAGPERGTPAT